MRRPAEGDKNGADIKKQKDSLTTTLKLQIHNYL